ncbi:MAG: tetratricopeptide repeat protein, partial [Methanophagales archaeon]|nr:tetratricopeptide repeat protein [Methanophagales archaeon]
REFEEAIRIKPQKAECRCYLANLLIELGRYEDAEKEFKKALELNPNDYLTHNDYGVLLHNWKRYDEAEREFKDALGLNPEKKDEASIHINLGALFEEWGCYGHYEEAKSEYEEAIAILRALILTKPEVGNNLARAHYNLGTLLADKLEKFGDAKGEFKEAIRIFKEAIKIDPELAVGLAMAHNNLGASLCDSEKYKEAMEEYIKAIETVQQFKINQKRRRDNALNQKRSNFFGTENNCETASIGINKEIEKEDSRVYINLGNVYGKLNCIDLAIENFKNAIEADPKNAEANQNLVWAELNKKGVGLSWWDWWQTCRSKKWIGRILGLILGGAILYLGYLVYLDYQGIQPNLLILIVIIVFLLLFPEIQYFKAGPFELAKEPRYFSLQPKSFYVSE